MFKRKRQIASFKLCFSIHSQICSNDDYTHFSTTTVLRWDVNICLTSSSWKWPMMSKNHNIFIVVVLWVFYVNLFSSSSFVAFSKPLFPHVLKILVKLRLGWFVGTSVLLVMPFRLRLLLLLRKLLLLLHELSLHLLQFEPLLEVMIILDIIYYCISHIIYSNNFLFSSTLSLSYKSWLCYLLYIIVHSMNSLFISYNLSLSWVQYAI